MAVTREWLTFGPGWSTLFQNYSVIMSQSGRVQTFSVTSPHKLHLSLRGEGNAFVSPVEPALAFAVPPSNGFFLLAEDCGASRAGEF
jgi:hypothetical protein